MIEIMLCLYIIIGMILSQIWIRGNPSVDSVIEWLYFTIGLSMIWPLILFIGLILLLDDLDPPRWVR